MSYVDVGCLGAARDDGGDGGAARGEPGFLRPGRAGGADGRGVTVTRLGVPVVRIVPIDEDGLGLTAEQSALLERTLGEKLDLVPWRFERDALHER